MEAADRQLGVAVPNSPHSTSHYMLTTHIQNGVTYIVISDSYIPTAVIHNLCPFTLAYGQVWALFLAKLNLPSPTCDIVSFFCISTTL